MIIMMSKAFVGTVVVFLAIDVLWINWVARPMYEDQIGSLLRTSPKLGAAAAFYIIYTAGIVYFAVAPGLAADSLSTAVVKGAVLGALAYGTYAFTCFAMLKGWTFTLAAADVGWGIVLTGVSAAGGVLAARLGS